MGAVGGFAGGMVGTLYAGGTTQQAFDNGLKGANNIGTAGKVDINSWFGEGGKVSRFLNKIPGVNAVAGSHDTM